MQNSEYPILIIAGTAAAVFAFNNDPDGRGCYKGDISVVREGVTVTVIDGYVCWFVLFYSITDWDAKKVRL